MTILWSIPGTLICMLPFFAAWKWGGESAEFWLLLGQAWVASVWQFTGWLDRRQR